MADRHEVANRAHTYYYPLVENIRQIERYVTTGVGSNPAAAFNSFSRARTLAGPRDTFVTINNDTLYSMAQLDLSVGPIRLEVPEMGDRYYVLQFVDAWTNNIAYVGTRATGNRPGRFLIVPADWDGTAPDGYRLVTSPTRLLSIVGRYACSGPDDLPGANAAQDATILEPLHPDAPPPRGIPPVAEVPESVLFWERARAWSQDLPAPADDQVHEEQFAPLGVLEADSPYPALDDAEIAALADDHATAVEALEELTRAFPAPVNNGWTVGLHMFDYSTSHLGLGTVDESRWKIADREARIGQRAASARLGLWGNHSYEAVYAQGFTTVDGKPLDGTRTYSIHFAELPPVDAFWSITLYDIPRYYLVDNAIDRYSIGDRTPGIEYGEDGSFTVTVSSDEPTDRRGRANWLPAPKDRFRLVLRLYNPQEPILDGTTYRFPPVVEVTGSPPSA